MPVDSEVRYQLQAISRQQTALDLSRPSTYRRRLLEHFSDLNEAVVQVMRGP